MCSVSQLLYRLFAAPFKTSMGALVTSTGSCRWLRCTASFLSLHIQTKSQERSGSKDSAAPLAAEIVGSYQEERQLKVGAH